MLSVYTVPEALEWLKKNTGQPWSESKLFDAACKMHLTMRAVPPRDAETEIHVFQNGKFAVKDFGDGVLATRMGWRMAVLHPAHIVQVWQTGETETRNSVGDGVPQGEVEKLSMPATGQDREEIERWFFTSPVKVTRKMVRVTQWVLNRILDAQPPPPVVPATEALPLPLPVPVPVVVVVVVEAIQENDLTTPEIDTQPKPPPVMPATEVLPLSVGGLAPSRPGARARTRWTNEFVEGVERKRLKQSAVKTAAEIRVSVSTMNAALRRARRDREKEKSKGLRVWP